MKRLFFTVFLILGLMSAYAQNFLDFLWQINGRDSIQWQAVDFVPRQWKSVNISISLERQGYGSYAGYYSLWNQVVIPAKYKNVAAGNLQLRFKFEAEKAEVFFNGHSVGSSKKPGSEEVFDLPKSLVHWNKPNAVLVRIHNSFYTGGACATYIHIVPTASKKDIILNASFSNEQRLFLNASDIRFEGAAISSDGKSFEGVQKLIVVNDFHDTVFVHQSKVKASSGKQVIPYSLGKLAPGFYQVQLSFSANGGESQQISWFAVDPEKIAAHPNNPQEVWNFWINARKELATISPQFKCKKVDSLCTEKNDVFIVEMKSLNNITVRGWYIVPSKQGVFPAILHLPGYSVAMQPQRFLNDTDFIHLALDIRGHGMSADVINPGFTCPGYVGVNLDKPEQYIYRGALMDCCRAIDFLLSRAEVDTNRIAVKGHSQGGGLSLATAALNPGIIKYCVAGSPFLSDFKDHIKIRSLYKDEMEYYMQHNSISEEQVCKTMNLVDAVNLCPFIQCPVLMGVGFFDDDTPPHINFAAYNNIKSQKQYYVLPHKGHSLGSEWSNYLYGWLRSMFKLK